LPGDRRLALRSGLRCKAIVFSGAWCFLAGFALGQGTVKLKPGDDVVSIVNAHGAATTYVFASGIYRLTGSINPHDGDTFSGPCGSPPCAGRASAILNGSQLISPVFNATYRYWSVRGRTQALPQAIYDRRQCEPGWEGCYLPEDLYFTDKITQAVTVKHRLETATLPALPEMAAGDWYFDDSSHAIYMKDDPADFIVETGVAEAAFRRWDASQNGGSKANDVTIRGLTIEKFANPLTKGAIGCCGTGNGDPKFGINYTLQDNEIRYNHSTGIKANFGWRMHGNFIHHNGTFGINASPGNATLASGIVIEDNEIAYNNVDSHTDRKWGGGGNKSTESLGLIYRHNNVHDNFGAGLWTDISNRSTLFDGNTIRHNTGPGIMHEISWGATLVRNNRLLNNDYVHDVASRGGWDANLFSSSSSGVEAYCNTIRVDAAGGNAMIVLASDRGADSYRSPPDNAYRSQGNRFHHNTVFWDGIDANDWGLVGAVQYDASHRRELFTENSFDSNQYHIGSLAAAAFRWSGNRNHAETFNAFQSDGQEAHGTIDTKNQSSAPEVSISFPPDGSTVSGVVALSATAADPRYAIAKMELYVDWALASTLASGPPFAFHWNTVGLAAGPHTVAAMAYNSNGVRSCFAITVQVRP
jgi:parallel beta-helix repeat protein